MSYPRNFDISAHKSYSPGFFLPHIIPPKSQNKQQGSSIEKFFELFPTTNARTQQSKRATKRAYDSDNIHHQIMEIRYNGIRTEVVRKIYCPFSMLATSIYIVNVISRRRTHKNIYQQSSTLFESHKEMEMVILLDV